MPSHKELVSYIRFQLSQLASRNQHHEFEDLTRAFARLRICERVIPATGPVGSGGDQGRDFETYRSYLASTPIATSSSIGLAPDIKLVFACTLQKKSLNAKIKSDLALIFAHKEKPGRVYYFCEANVSIGNRHKLQDHCRDLYGCELDILDGAAISEQLSALEVFWIAEEYLDIPAEYFPTADRPNKRYLDCREKWISSATNPSNYADFFEIKYGLRRATFHKDAHPDLPNWIKKMRSIATSQAPNELRRRASYEICVATLRGLNALQSEEETVLEYFSNIHGLSSPRDLEDCGVLLVYVSAASTYGHFSIDIATLHKWSKQYLQVLDDTLKNVTNRGMKCRLLEMRGRASLLAYKDGVEPKPDTDEALTYWARLLDEVDGSPLFPLEHFADVLSIMTTACGENPKFLQLTKRVDELLTERTSGFVAAEKCRDRAVAYFEIEKYCLALKQLHQAKVKWFAAETMRGSLLSMLLLAECYRKLNLFEAARYFSLCAAYIAFHDQNESLRSFMPRALFLAANISHQAGESANFLDLLNGALLAHNAFDPNPLILEDHADLQNSILHVAILWVASKKFGSSHADAVEKAIEGLPVDQQLKDGIRWLADSDGYWENADVDEVWERCKTELANRPFNDCGTNRVIAWRALGIIWQIELENTHALTCLGEEVASTLQILLADIADFDLCLLPTTVRIKVGVNDGSEPALTETPSNDAYTWELEVPSAWITDDSHMNDMRSYLLAATFTFLTSCSVLASTEVEKIVETTFSDALPLKTFTARSYGDLYRNFVPSSDQNIFPRSTLAPLEESREFPLHCATELNWISAPGPGYSSERAEEHLKNRYTRAIRPIRRSLEIWKEDPNFCAMVRKLQGEGYRDWYIVTVLMNIAANHRMELQGVSQKSFPEMKSAMEALVSKEEDETDPPIPMELLSEQQFDEKSKLVLVSIASTWGLTVRRDTPDFTALERLLDTRYRNRIDDIEHDDLF